MGKLAFHWENFATGQGGFVSELTQKIADNLTANTRFFFRRLKSHTLFSFIARVHWFSAWLL